eukprot:TRINITY_DN70_c1_g1_i5.p1 TRINITY_DN70_c1_g1~~TRINITY_DN70_c1_g1_i5.p1  ORF type:complete len:736 (+),score=80.62 TRINITY_DN70_c1_g1_i5:66-2210(+)
MKKQQKILQTLHESLGEMLKWRDVSTRKEHAREALKATMVMHMRNGEKPNEVVESDNELLSYLGKLLRDGPTHERPQDVSAALRVWMDAVNYETSGVYHEGPGKLAMLPFEKVLLHIPVLLLYEGAFVQSYMVVTDAKISLLINPNIREHHEAVEIPILLLKNISIFEECRGETASILELSMKNGWLVHICVPDLDQVVLTRSVLEAFLPSNYSKENFFAFKYHNEMRDRIPRRTVEDVLDEEYHRIIKQAGGASSSRWRVTSANENFNISDTMPEKSIVPWSISDDQVSELANFRINKRFPMVSWIHPRNGAALVRSSQPTVGLKNKTSEIDEKYMRKIAVSQDLYTAVVDARPFKNAVANLANGGGYISLKNYPKCKHVNANIPNIHAMTASLYKLRDLLTGSSPTDDGDWLPKLHASNWVRHIQRILQISIHIVFMLDREATTVLVHCTNGWDRTSQIVALSNIMLDPYYRTLKGFLALHEKDWASGAHKFGERVGSLGSDRHRAKGVSPIFLQFLECVVQILRQFPSAFEYTEEFLRHVANSPWEGKVGTYMVNTPKERCDIENHTISLTEQIEYLLSESGDHAREFTNEGYEATQSVLYPSSHPKDLSLWLSYHCLIDRRVKLSLRHPERCAPSTGGRPRWYPDKLAETCLSCRTLFTIVTRRHHCRQCGYIFCGACSYKKTSIGRVCTTCIHKEPEKGDLSETAGENA